MIATALRAATASWHLRVSEAPSVVTLPILFERDLVEQFGQHGGITEVAGGEFGLPNFQ